MLLVLIIPHEWGHMIVAKMCGVKVNEFSVGMGPLIFKRQKGETQYSVRLLPLGGYCAMEGEEEAVDDPRSYSSKTPFQKIAILLAGVTMNILIAILAVTLAYFIAGVPSTTLGSITPDSPAAAAGLQAGDKIIAIDGVETKTWNDVVDVINGYHEGDRLDIQYRRDGKNMEAFITPVYDEETQRYMVGIVAGMSRNPVTCISGGISSTWEMAKMMLGAFQSMIKGGIKKGDVSGPVGLVKVVDQTASYGFTSYLMLLALVSLNLAFFNIIPIPGLDGGKIFFIILKIVSLGRINDEMEYKATIVGMALLLALFVFVTYNDIMNIVG
jgi:regulator of sigma E protease